MLACVLVLWRVVWYYERGMGGTKHTHVLQHIGGIVSLWALAVAHLLGLLAMIKCSICSYQCDN